MKLYYGNEIVLDHIVQINNPNEYIELRERKGFDMDKFLMYLVTMWVTTLTILMGMSVYMFRNKNMAKLFLAVGGLLGVAETIVLLFVAFFVW